jgi:hypothetical protein
MNLGAKFKDAEAAVLAATPGNEGKSFDQVFHLALGLLKQPAAYAKRGAA